METAAQDCLFCKIKKGEVPASVIMENDYAISFLDIKPVNKGHALVMPKAHYTNLYDTPEYTLCHMIEMAKKLAPAIKEAVGADGINIRMNNEEAAGQLIFHTHMHIIPRFKDDGFEKWHGKQTFSDEELAKIAEEIKAKLK